MSLKNSPNSCHKGNFAYNKTYLLPQNKNYRKLVSRYTIWKILYKAKCNLRNKFTTRQKPLNCPSPSPAFFFPQVSNKSYGMTCTLPRICYYSSNELNIIFTFLSTSLSESLADELEDTSSFDLGILQRER